MGRLAARLVNRCLLLLLLLLSLPRSSFAAPPELLPPPPPPAEIREGRTEVAAARRRHCAGRLRGRGHGFGAAVFGSRRAACGSRRAAPAAHPRRLQQLRCRLGALHLPSVQS